MINKHNVFDQQASCVLKHQKYYSFINRDLYVLYTCLKVILLSNQNNEECTQTKIESLVLAYNDIQDRLYEIDKSWKNNLIFYGIPIDSNMEDEDPYATEEKVRELIKRKLRITREIPFNRVTRVFHGPEFRGQKPVQVSKFFGGLK